MKKILLISLLLVAAGFGQNNLAPQNIVLGAPPPTGVVAVSASVVGPIGNTTFYYWVVAIFPVGRASVSSPGLLTNAPGVLSGGNYVRVSWNAVVGATGYDVLRTTTPTLPSSCICAVVTNTGATSRNDTGSALSGYAVSSIPNATAHINLVNSTFPQPVLYNDTPVNSVLFANLPAATVSTGLTYLVVDSLTAGNCAAGGGSNTPTICWSNGSIYVALGGGSGTFVTLSGDTTSQANGGATVVNGIKGVLFCTGYTPTNGQFVEYTTGGSPNPCYAAASASSGMTWPTTPGIGVCTGTPCTAWGTSITGLSQTLVGYMANVTSDIQAQLNAKQATLVSYTTITALWSGTKDSSHCTAGDGTMQSCAGGGSGGVNLQSSAPGTQQTGNINVSGIVEADGGFTTGSSAALLLQGLEEATPTVTNPTIYLDSTAHIPQYLNASSVKVGTMVAPLADPGTDHNWVKYIPATGVPSRTHPACADLSDSGVGCSLAVATIATASTLAERNSSGEVIAVNTLPTGLTATTPRTTAIGTISASQAFTVLANSNPMIWTGTMPSGTVTSTMVTTAATVGQLFQMDITQYSGGAVTFTFPSGWLNPCTISPTASIVTHAFAWWNGTNAIGYLCTTGDTPSTGILYFNASALPTVATTAQMLTILGVIPAANGGTNNAYFQVSGPASSAKTFTFPNASATIIQKIAGGTAALNQTNLGTGATLAANTCSSSYVLSATGTLSTDVVSVTANANIATIAGYGALTTDGLTIRWYPITDNIDWIACNQTGAAIAISNSTYPSINYMVIR
jgi:hypothetical protein